MGTPPTRRRPAAGWRRRTRRPRSSGSSPSCRSAAARCSRRCPCRTARPSAGSDRRPTRLPGRRPASASGSPARSRSPSASSDADHRDGVDVLAAGRERAVRGGHLEGVDLVRSEHGRQVREQRALRLRDALATPDPHPLGHVDDRLRAQLVDQLGVDGVHRVDRRLLEGEAAVVARLRVRHVPHLRRCRAGYRSSEGAENTVLGEIPFSSAATSANGLNDEPACRPVLPPVARFTRPSPEFASQ